MYVGAYVLNLTNRNENMNLSKITLVSLIVARAVNVCAMDVDERVVLRAVRHLGKAAKEKKRAEAIKADEKAAYDAQNLKNAEELPERLKAERAEKEKKLVEKAEKKIQKQDERNEKFRKDAEELPERLKAERAEKEKKLVEKAEKKIQKQDERQEKFRKDAEKAREKEAEKEAVENLDAQQRIFDDSVEEDGWPSVLLDTIERGHMRCEEVEQYTYGDSVPERVVRLDCHAQDNTAFFDNDPRIKDDLIEKKIMPRVNMVVRFYKSCAFEKLDLVIPWYMVRKYGKSAGGGASAKAGGPSAKAGGGSNPTAGDLTTHCSIPRGQFQYNKVKKNPEHIAVFLNGLDDTAFLREDLALEGALIKIGLSRENTRLFVYPLEQLDNLKRVMSQNGWTEQEDAENQFIGKKGK